LVERRG